MSWFSRIIRNKTIGQLFRFGLVGTIATALHFGVYLGTKTFVSITVAYILGYGISIIVNFFLTSLFTFKKKPSIETGLGFLCAHLLNLALQTGLLHLFIYLGISSTYAPIPVFAIAIPVNFLLLRFVFSRRLALDHPSTQTEKN